MKFFRQRVYRPVWRRRGVYVLNAGARNNSPRTLPDRPPTRLGDGMGAVYEAVDQHLDTTVALKETLFSARVAIPSIITSF